MFIKTFLDAMTNFLMNKMNLLGNFLFKMKKEFIEQNRSFCKHDFLNKIDFVQNFHFKKKRNFLNKIDFVQNFFFFFKKEKEFSEQN